MVTRRRAAMPPISPTLGNADYRELLRLRTGLRQFLRTSEDFAREIGLTPAQHQLLLAVRGHDAPSGPTISDVATYLLLRHHSAVELVDRAVAAGLVRRRSDRSDARVARISLTPAGRRALDRLSDRNLDELRRLAEHFRPLLDDMEDHMDTTTGNIVLARVYDPSESAGRRLLVDRLWPRGLKKADANFEWRKDLAPSTELRRWYDHDPVRFEEFAARYRAELAERSGDLDALAGESLVLLTATKDVSHSGATVLAGAISQRRGPS
jgi:uncharacterized protein YeaO (DUF488 family)/DNA-binding MarR family transcriptional regulator